jgi:serine/threonine protein kinase
MSDTIICPFCGEAHRSVAKYCPATGKLLPTTSPTQQADVESELQNEVSHLKDITGQHQPLDILHTRFSILEKIGEGGMAAVYKASDLRLPGKLWALKEMSESWIPDPDDRAMAVQAFKQEALLLAKLNHPNLPRVIDSFSEKDRQYLVMEYIEGETLEKILQKKSTPFTEEQVLPWAVQLCDVLSYLHNLAEPVIFRDLKPSNIMIDRSNQVKLIDFGIVRFFKPGKTKDTMAIGTHGYIAPEAISGQTDARSDLYSLCVVLHEMLTKHNPTTTLFNLPPIRQFNPSISQEWERIIQRGLAQDRRERWMNTRILREQLSKTTVLKAEPIEEPDLVLSPPTAKEQISKVESGGLIQSSRPTVRLVSAAFQLSTLQLGLGVGIVTAVVIAGLWFAAPYLVEIPALWNNIPLVAITAPFVYALAPKRWVASVAHAIIAVAGGLTLYFRINMWDGYLIGLSIGIIVSAAFIEIWFRFLNKIRGEKGKEAWVRELAWFCGMSVIATGILYGSAVYYDFSPWVLLGALGMAIIGWFAGDSLKEYLNIRRTSPEKISR